MHYSQHVDIHLCSQHVEKNCIQHLISLHRHIWLMRERELIAPGSIRPCIDFTRRQVGGAPEGYASAVTITPARQPRGQQTHNTAGDISSSLLSATLAKLRECAKICTWYRLQLSLSCHSWLGWSTRTYRWSANLVKKYLLDHIYSSRRIHGIHG